jgi:hypothetical protein
LVSGSFPSTPKGVYYCALVAVLAQQSRLSARAGPDHTRVPSAHSDTPNHAQVLSSSASTLRLPPPTAAIAPERASPARAAATFIHFNDLHCFSATANTWTALSSTGSGPSGRHAMGFVATPDGMLWVFGGSGRGYGIEGKGRAAAVGGASCVGHCHADINLGIPQPIYKSTKGLWPQERCLQYQSRVGLEQGNSGFRTLRIDHFAIWETIYIYSACIIYILPTAPLHMYTYQQYHSSLKHPQE